MKWAFLGLMLMLPILSFAQQPDITGTWHAPGEQGSGTVEIYYGADGKLYGKFVQATDPEQDKEIRQRLKEEGKSQLLILKDFKYSSKNTWTGGTVLSVSRGTRYDCKLRLKDANHLEVTGYVAFGLFSKSFTWYR